MASSFQPRNISFRLLRNVNVCSRRYSGVIAALSCMFRHQRSRLWVEGQSESKTTASAVIKDFNVECAVKWAMGTNRRISTDTSSVALPVPDKHEQQQQQQDNLHLPPQLQISAADYFFVTVSYNHGVPVQVEWSTFPRWATQKVNSMSFRAEYRTSEQKTRGHNSIASSVAPSTIPT